MKRHFIAVASAAFVYMLLQPLSASSQGPCANLINLPLPDTTITAAHEVPAGSFTPPGSGTQTNLPAFCRVALTVAPAVRIEVWMPSTTWNERYQGVGGGGYAGSISYGGLASGIRAGYAAASTDTGHLSSQGGRFALNPDGTLNHQLILDFAERSLHQMVLKAKALINAYYGAAPKYSYWTGCSTGGRQGLMAVQRFPEEYDGLLIGAPAINWDRFIPAMLWGNIVMQQELGGQMSSAKLGAVSSDAVAACDAADEITDGVVHDPRRCHYDPAASICQAGSDPATCLTPAEANAVRKMWEGPLGARTGKRVWYFYERSASFANLSNPSNYSIPEAHFSHWLAQDASFDWRTVTEAAFESWFRLSQRKFNEVIGTDEDNIQRFRKRGGKVIIWHGEDDARIMPRGTVNYFDRVLASNGGPKHVDHFARLFLAPGVAHCGGGAGPQPVGLFEAVVNWVENGAAPATIPASRTLPDGTVRTRPLCPYPKTAKWIGAGSTDDAANFACVDGGHDANDFRITGPGTN